MQLAQHLAARLSQGRREAQELDERYSQGALARLTLKHVEEIEGDLTALLDEALTLKQAADETGYSDDYLGRLVRDGKLENVGRKNAPRVRRGDLPRKAHLQESETTFSLGSTRMQIARAVVTANAGGE